MSGGRLTGRHSHARNCDLVAAEVARFVAAVRGADPATPVPTCGRWKLVDLIHHTSQVHRWAAGMVAEYSPTRHSRRKRDLPLPDDPADDADWLGEARTLKGHGDRLLLVATDRPDAWTITLTDRGYDWDVCAVGPGAKPPGAGGREVSVRAGAAELYLLLWRRLPTRQPGNEVSGDADLLEFWLRNAVI